MKTRLLKKLRREAKKEYWIEVYPKEILKYWVRSCRCGYGHFLDSFRTLEEAMKDLTRRRRNYILSQIEGIRLNKLEGIRLNKLDI